MKPVYRWEPVMATGIAFMDDEHRHLVNELAALEAAFASGDRVAIAGRFKALLDAVAGHFAHEEQAMLGHGGVQREYAEHKLEHDDFLMQLRFFGSRLDKSGHNPQIDILDFVSTWMVAHVLGQDRKMSHILAGSGGMARAA